MREDVHTFDAAVERFFDEHMRGKPAADRLFYGASELGDFGLIWLILGAVRGLRSEHDWHAAVRLGAALGAESVLVNIGIKSLFRRSRPPWEQDRPLRLRRPMSSSFPSGHATSAVTAAILLSEDDPPWPLYWAAAGVVAASRVHVKIHHASDVVGGLVFGALIGTAIKRLRPLPDRLLPGDFPLGE